MRGQSYLVVSVSLSVIALASACQKTSADGRPGNATVISAGGNQTCISDAVGVKCWGENRVGQLGDGTVENRNVPVTVTMLTEKVSALAVGYTYACAVTLSGEIVCWGSNVVDSSEGGKVTGFQAVAVGTTHLCGLTTSGGVNCWGGNSFGALGDGSTESRQAPVDVVGLNSGVTALAVGVDFSCAVHNRGAKCWGSNDTGQLGNGAFSNSLVPADVFGLDLDLAGVAAGVFHACAWKSNGEVWCWGDNITGELGDGTWINSPIPVSVGGLEGGVQAVVVGGSHTCALTRAGGVKCWGGNAAGQLGDGTTTDRNAPVDVAGLSSGVVAIAAGGSHTCAMLEKGSVKCWGRNEEGQLGNGANENSSTPVNVAFPAE